MCLDCCMLLIVSCDICQVSAFVSVCKCVCGLIQFLVDDVGDLSYSWNNLVVIPVSKLETFCRLTRTRSPYWNSSSLGDSWIFWCVYSRLLLSIHSWFVVLSSCPCLCRVLEDICARTVWVLCLGVVLVECSLWWCGVVCWDVRWRVVLNPPSFSADLNSISSDTSLSLY